MILSDHTIKEELRNGNLVIDPLDENNVQPASVDLRLDREILEFHSERYSYLDVREDLSALTEPVLIPDPSPYILKRGTFILATTLEYVELSDDIVARLEGKSSLGRLGLLIHSTAGYVDPGWKGQLTLEISNVANVDIALYYGMKISQISYIRLSTKAEHPYGSESLGSKYQGQRGPTPTRTYLDFNNHKKHLRSYPDEPTELRRWLENSSYGGSVSRLAIALAVPEKTVEDWVYGRHEPSSENEVRLFELTGLTKYAPRQVGRQADFLSDEFP